MSRTSIEPKTRFIKLRLTEEQYEAIDCVNKDNLSKTIRELIQIGLENRDRLVAVSDYTASEKDVAEMSAMAECCGMTYEEMLHEVKNLLEIGEIKCANGMLYTDVCPFDYKELVALCQEKRIPPQEAVKKLCQILERE